MFERFAVYFTPEGELASRGAAWLGWDVALAQPAAHPSVADLDVPAITETPRKYGLHGTIKPPFRLAEGTDVGRLSCALSKLCSKLAPVRMEGLEVSRLGRFLALTPKGSHGELSDLAAETVMRLDSFRAPPTAEELARRRVRPLTPAQERNLSDWGYPHVMDQFRFHITLTGPLAAPERILPAVAAHFTPVLPEPFLFDSLTLAGQRADGRFQELQRYTLRG